MIRAFVYCFVCFNWPNRCANVEEVDFSTFSSFYTQGDIVSRWRRPPRLREINAINGLQMKRLLYSGQYRDECQERPAQLKGHLTHLLPAQREIKFAVSRPRFLFAVRQHNHNDLFICHSAMINYECFTIIWKDVSRYFVRSTVSGKTKRWSTLFVGFLFWN